MELIITLAFVAMIALLLLTTWQHRIITRQDKTITQQADRITELEAKVAERSGDVIRLGQTILAERASHFGREREAALGRE